MILLKKTFHFLGGIYFAIGLILSAACITLAGTIVESRTGSHLLAAQLTYEHPLFQLLLSLFFINILFSALRRWPFKPKHLPFLITHCGLLMILAGTMIKNRYGLQGQMMLWEGGGSHQVLLPHTYALHIEKKTLPFQKTVSSLIPLPTFRPEIYFPYHFPELKFRLIGYAQHVKDKKETWLKENILYVSGMPPLPVEEWKMTSPFPIGSTHLFKRGETSERYRMIAIRTQNLQQALREAYLHDLTLHLADKNGREAIEIALKDVLESPIRFAEGIVSASLTLPQTEEDKAHLHLHWQHQENGAQVELSIVLQGSDALLITPSPTSLGNTRFLADLHRSMPLLCFMEGKNEHTHLLALDSFGRFHQESFDSSNLKSLIVYDRGHGGYALQAVIPFSTFSSSRENKEKAAAYALTQKLREALTEQPSLSPPLKLLELACREAQVDFIATFVQFLSEWKASTGMIFLPSRSLPADLKLALKQLDWRLASQKEQQAILWTNRLLTQLEPDIGRGEPLPSILERNHWPLLTELQEQLKDPSNGSPLNILAEQLFHLVPYLPELEFPREASEASQTSLLAAYFRIYGIDESFLNSAHREDEEELDLLETFWKAHLLPEAVIEKALVLETPLTHRIIPDTAPLETEQHRPGIVLEIEHEKDKQTVALAYETLATGMKWPVLNGQFLVRLQPFIQEIPHRLRLRQARQIHYPDSGQVYSYESDVLVMEDGKNPLPYTLSMNHVYETWDGYRFYLSGVGSSASNLKHIQIAVNHDPAKYILTYPGAALVFTGIILLFWILPYRKNGSG